MMISLSRLKALAEKATPGPWQARLFVQAAATPTSKAIDKSKITPLQNTPLGSLVTDDANYIAAVYPEVVTAMLRVIEAAQRLQEVRRSYGEDDHTTSLDVAAEFDRLDAALKEFSP